MVDAGNHYKACKLMKEKRTFVEAFLKGSRLTGHKVNRNRLTGADFQSA